MQLQLHHFLPRLHSYILLLFLQFIILYLELSAQLLFLLRTERILSNPSIKRKGEQLTNNSEKHVSKGFQFQRTFVNSSPTQLAKHFPASQRFHGTPRSIRKRVSDFSTRNKNNQKEAEDFINGQLKAEFPRGSAKRFEKAAPNPHSRLQFGSARSAGRLLIVLLFVRPFPFSFFEGTSYSRVVCAGPARR